MLTITGGKQNNKGHLTRRSVLKIGALSAGGLTLADMLRLQSQGAVKSASRHKTVISVYLRGAPSHQDMYDLKPNAPSEYRGEFSPIATNVPGMDICELMPLQATIGDKLAIILYADNGARGISPRRVAAVLLLTQRASIAFERLIRKRKGAADRMVHDGDDVALEFDIAEEDPPPSSGHAVHEIEEHEFEVLAEVAGADPMQSLEEIEVVIDQ